MTVRRVSAGSASGSGGRSPRARPASSTRPIEVAYAGKRVPTVMLTLMIRTVGTRATYRMSAPSSTASDADSRTRPTSAAR
ncbi:hypothetical protein AS594_04870 [Streptomyces agglomeratus]|uniref:Uncharacterized protein n=1 Tax=Streptomyces agglomeratus TaxID=285458 RepID=A0A1E5P2Y8_9ACTN|nr:hypothetical protein AS594_04870 [Streptomyces agglomeratus]